MYASALVFSPSQSIIRKLFREEEPFWLDLKPAVEKKWSACLATLEGHGGEVRSVAFSPDGGYIITDSGTLLLPLSQFGSLPTFFQQPCDTHQLGINYEWITCNNRNLLWLPPDYRPRCSAVTAQAIAIGCSSGRVWMSTFLLDYVSL